MAQSSQTISGQKTFKSAITVSEGATFTATGGVYKITAASTSLANLAVRDLITITGTTFTTDLSTTISSNNFTGNFVWVRAKCTSNTAGSVTKILYNN